jgi:hypothetical protein
MASQIFRVQQEFNGDVESPLVTIHLCILQHGFSLHKDFALQDIANLAADDLQREFHLELAVSRSALLRVENLNGWTLET